MKPQIEFKHVLSELSVNRNDPCEIIRELVSNSYDALAKNIFFSPLKEEKGFIYFDDGTGLDTKKTVNGITPYEAFFSIGKSTKKKGEAIGYKCQGSKLCFACARILVATKVSKRSNDWQHIAIENPRRNLDTESDISPFTSKDIEKVINEFLPQLNADAQSSVKALIEFIEAQNCKTGTLIIIDNLDTENFVRYFQFGKRIEESYLYNYIRFNTKHGDIRKITKSQGFSPSHITQVSDGFEEAKFVLFSGKKLHEVPFGFPYLDAKEVDTETKSPLQVSRLRDGRFYSRSAKRFSVSGNYYSIVCAVDGNRRAHEDYPDLDRKGKSKSGIRLSDQRGFFISVNGIKICKHMDVLQSLEDFEVLTEGESLNHYTIILEGNFDLVTNRNSLSKKAFDDLANPDFLAEIKKFLQTLKRNDKIFQELLSRLRKESTENKLNEQIEILNQSKSELKRRERFKIRDSEGKENTYVSPMPGEEYLVGVLYASLYNHIPANSKYKDYWKRIATFSTQGIDSLAFNDPTIAAPLAEKNVLAIEYKYSFTNTGPFNHALAIVDYIIAWEVELDSSKNIRDTYTCFGSSRPIRTNDFEWEIFEICSDDGAEYQKNIKVICLKKLIEKTFSTKFISPSNN